MMKQDDDSNTNIMIPDSPYIDISKIRMENICIGQSPINYMKCCKRYNWNYKYCEFIEDKLTIYVQDLKLTGSVRTDFSNPYLCYDKESGFNLDTMLQQLKLKYIKYIEDNEQDHDIRNLEDLKNKKPHIKIKYGETQIIKLGSKKENNKNKKIDVNEYNKLVFKKNNNNDIYYTANLLISIKCFMYKNRDEKYISFNPFIKLMEIKINKAKCKSTINTNDNYVVINNTIKL